MPLIDEQDEIKVPPRSTLYYPILLLFIAASVILIVVLSSLASSMFGVSSETGGFILIFVICPLAEAIWRLMIKPIVYVSVTSHPNE